MNRTAITNLIAARPHPAFLQGVFILATLTGMLILSGCSNIGSAGSLHTRSLGDQPVILPAKYVAAYFGPDPQGSMSFMLTDVAVEQVIDRKVSQGQILHVDLLWEPKPGSTPIDPSATNASLRLVVIANGEVGVYGGAGFALPSGKLDGRSVTLTLRDASLQLQDATPGFRDLLSPAEMTGTFTAKRDETKTRQLNHAASQIVTDALGRTRIVMAR